VSLAVDQPTVLFEDNHVLVTNKPAGMLVQADATGDPCLVAWAKSYRKKHEHKPGQAYIGLIHRLDRQVSGVVLLAKTSKSAARLSQQFRERLVHKIYWAVVEVPVQVDLRNCVGTWRDVLKKFDETNRVRIVAPGEGQLAVTQVRVRGENNHRAWLELRPETGRPHQLRVQCAARRLPILGDVKYGGKPFQSLRGIALHSESLAFEHPTLRTPLIVHADVPIDWQSLPFNFCPLPP
jgi:23S rRNA pseudouridine1911/1915/1917 synthase